MPSKPYFTMKFIVEYNDGNGWKRWIYKTWRGVGLRISKISKLTDDCYQLNVWIGAESDTCTQVFEGTITSHARH